MENCKINVEDIQLKMKTIEKICSDGMKGKLNLSPQKIEKIILPGLSSAGIGLMGNLNTASQKNKNKTNIVISASNDVLASETKPLEKIDTCNKELPITEILSFSKELVENNALPQGKNGSYSDCGEKFSISRADDTNLVSHVDTVDKTCEEESSSQSCTDKRNYNVTESDDIIMPITINSVVSSISESSSKNKKIITGISDVSSANLISSVKFDINFQDETSSMECCSQKTAFPLSSAIDNAVDSSYTSEVCSNNERDYIHCEIMAIKELKSNEHSKSEIDDLNTNSFKGNCSPKTKDIVNLFKENSNLVLSTNNYLEESHATENVILLAKCNKELPTSEILSISKELVENNALCQGKKGCYSDCDEEISKCRADDINLKSCVDIDDKTCEEGSTSQSCLAKINSDISEYNNIILPNIVDSVVSSISESSSNDQKIVADISDVSSANLISSVKFDNNLKGEISSIEYCSQNTAFPLNSAIDNTVPSSDTSEVCLNNKRDYIPCKTMAIKELKSNEHSRSEIDDLNINPFKGSCSPKTKDIVNLLKENSNLALSTNNCLKKSHTPENIIVLTKSNKELLTSEILSFSKELVENNALCQGKKGCYSGCDEEISKSRTDDTNLNSHTDIEDKADDIILPTIIDSALSSISKSSSNDQKIGTGIYDASSANLISSVKFDNNFQDETSSMECCSQKIAFPLSSAIDNTVDSSYTSEVCLNNERDYIPCKIMAIKELKSNEHSKSEIDDLNINSFKGNCSPKTKDIINLFKDNSNLVLSTNNYLEESHAPENVILVAKCNKELPTSEILSISKELLENNALYQGKKGCYSDCDEEISKSRADDANLKSCVDVDDKTCEEGSTSQSCSAKINSDISEANNIILPIIVDSVVSSISESSSNDQKIVADISDVSSANLISSVKFDNNLKGEISSMEYCSQKTAFPLNSTMDNTVSSSDRSKVCLNIERDYIPSKIVAIKELKSNEHLNSEIDDLNINSSNGTDTDIEKQISLIGIGSKNSSSDILDNTLIPEGDNFCSKVIISCNNSPLGENYSLLHSSSDNSKCSINSFTKVNSKTITPESSVVHSNLGTDLQTYCNENPNTLTAVKSSIDTNITECEFINEDSHEVNIVLPQKCINIENSPTDENLISLPTCKEFARNSIIEDSPRKNATNELALSLKSDMETSAVDPDTRCDDSIQINNDKCPIIDINKGQSITGNENSTGVIGLDAKSTGTIEIGAVHPEIRPNYNLEKIYQENASFLIANKNTILCSDRPISGSSCLGDSFNIAYDKDVNTKVSLISSNICNDPQKSLINENKILLTTSKYSNLDTDGAVITDELKSSSENSSQICEQGMSICSNEILNKNSMLNTKNEMDSYDNSTLSNIKIICVTSLETKSSLKVPTDEIDKSDEKISSLVSNVIETLTNEQEINTTKLNCIGDNSQQQSLSDAIKATVLFSDKLMKLPSNDEIDLPNAMDDQSNSSDISQIDKGLSKKRKFSDDIGDDIVFIKKSSKTDSSKHMVVIKQESLEELKNETSGAADIMNTMTIKEEISEKRTSIGSCAVDSTKLQCKGNNDELNLIHEPETISTSIVDNKHKRKKASPRKTSNYGNKRKKSQSSKNEKKAPSNSLQYYFIALPKFLHKVSESFPSLVVQRERTDEENVKVKVTCVLFEEKVLDWAFTDTLLSTADCSRNINQKHPVGGKSTLIFPPVDNPRDIYYCLDLGFHFPFSMPNQSVVEPSEEIITLPYPLQQLSKLCPNSSGIREMYSKEKIAMETIQFDSTPLEWAFNETMLSSFNDSPILSYNLKLTNEWPDLSMDYLGVLEVDYSFPFTCPNSRRQFESILLEPLVAEIPVELRDITIDIHEVPAHLWSEMDLERGSLLRLLAIASYYSYVLRIKCVQSNPQLSMSISAIVSSFKPLIISQANSFGMKIEEARRISLDGFYSRDKSILPCLLRGPIVGSKKNLFSHSGLVKLEKSVANDKKNVLKRKL